MADLALVSRGIAYLCAVWGFFIFCVQSIGISRIFLKYSSRPRPSVSATLRESEVPHITIIRPAKGLEPELYECIASTFRQEYPISKLTIHLCVSEKADPCYPILQKLVADFPQFDARVLVEEEDPLLHGQDGDVNNLGPNPKIRNISRGYREAKGDIIWVIDCNVWVGRGVAGRMVDKLLGLRPNGKMATPFKFVHLLPLVVDTASWNPSRYDNLETTSLMSPIRSTEWKDGSDQPKSFFQRVQSTGGGLLDEMFMATTHAKFYSAINTVGVAPCIVGKSNMFRKSHLEQVTNHTLNPILPAKEGQPTGIDYFSNYICEDHLIGDLLWRSSLPGCKNHGLVFGDLAIQPMCRTTIAAYVGRRVRWLRARKWTVLLATLVEPGVESLLCCAYTSFALTTIPWFHDRFGLAQTWSAMFLYWMLAVSAWMVGDWFAYSRLHTGYTVEVDENTPKFARGTMSPGGAIRRPIIEWVPAWIAREILALPIWTWAVLLGSTVSWRGKHFRVRMDMSVVEIDSPSRVISEQRAAAPRLPHEQAIRSRSKDRLD